MKSSPQKKSPPVTFLVSQEALLLQDAVNARRSEVVAPAVETFNVDLFDAPQDGLRGALEACQQLPVMAPQRFVWVRRAHKLSAEDQALLLAYVASPNPTTVLLVTAERLDARTKFAQALTRAKVVEKKEPPPPKAMPDWVIDRARTLNCTLSRATAQLLVERVGPIMGPLAAALDKLQVMAGTSRVISSALVLDGIAMSCAAHIFALSDALYQEPWTRLSALMGRLLADGQSPLGLIGLIARQVRLLLCACAYKGPHRELADALGVRPFVADQLASRARGLSAAKVEKDLAALAEIDVALKSSRLPPRLVLDQLAMRLAKPER